MSEGYLVCSPKPIGQSGQGEGNRAVVQKRPVSSAFQAEYSNVAGLSGETGRGLPASGSYIDAKLQGDFLGDLRQVLNGKNNPVSPQKRQF